MLCWSEDLLQADMNKMRVYIYISLFFNCYYNYFYELHLSADSCEK